jgi:cytoskeletal protein RodZ
MIRSLFGRLLVLVERRIKGQQQQQQEQRSTNKSSTRRRRCISITTLFVIIISITATILGLLPFYFVIVIQQQEQDNYDNGSDSIISVSDIKFTSVNDKAVVTTSTIIPRTKTTKTTNTTTVDQSTTTVQIPISIPYIKFDTLPGGEKPASNNTDLYKLLKSRMDVAIASDAAINANANANAITHATATANTNTNATMSIEVILGPLDSSVPAEYC